MKVGPNSVEGVTDSSCIPSAVKNVNNSIFKQTDSKAETVQYRMPRPSCRDEPSS
jgi:hypothetical protein